MLRPPSPCSQDCPRRTATCHAECNQNKVYEAAMAEFYASKQKLDARGGMSTAQLRRVRSIERGRKEGRLK